jgi:hypothetical protein
MRRIICTISFLGLLGGFGFAAAGAQTPSEFKSNPIGFFSAKGWQTWVGKGQFFGKNYTDSLKFTQASAGDALTVRRTLVETDSARVISRGTGLISHDPAGPGYEIRWTEKSYAPVTGHMDWQQGQWVVSFDGAWRDWNIGIRQDSTLSLSAAVSKLLPGIGAVDVAAMTYKRIP